MCMNSRILTKLEKIIETRQYCWNRDPWVLSEQVGDKGSRRPLDGCDDEFGRNSRKSSKLGNIATTLGIDECPVS